MRARLHLLLIAACAAMLLGCRCPRLPLAQAAAPPRAAPAASVRTDSEAGRLAAPLLEGEGGEASRGYGARVSDAAIARAESAVKLRMEARRKYVDPCGAAERARTMPKPDINGDQAKGVGVDLGRFFSGLQRLWKRGLPR